jgi:radical SAM protein with 4Fe4S-binding SPASM domain
MKEIVWSRVIKAVSKKRIINALKVIASFGFSTLARKRVVWGLPIVLTVEPTVLCNLRCPECFTGMGRIHRETNMLSLELFRSLLDQVGDYVWYLLLYNQGEPFFHPHFLEFIELAKQRNIYVTTSTNGHFFNDNAFVQEFIESGIDSIIISLDGADAETYSKYRCQGNFNQVIEGIERLITIRNQRHSRTPAVFIQCLVMRQNEQQMQQMKNLAGDLKVDRLLFKTLQLERHDRGEELLPENPRWQRYQIGNEKRNIKNHAHKGCARLWYSSVMLSDGRIVPCCFDKNGQFSVGAITGNTSFKQIWKSDAYSKFRRKIQQGRNGIEICQNCTQNQKVYL